MFCTNCGKELNPNAVICVHCGVPVRVNQIYGIPAPQPYKPKVVNGLGIAGFVVGLLSIWFGAFFCIPAIVGLVLSIVGMVNIKKCTSANGLAIAGLVISIIALIFWFIFWMIIISAIGSDPYPYPY